MELSLMDPVTLGLSKIAEQGIVGALLVVSLGGNFYLLRRVFMAQTQRVQSEHNCARAMEKLTRLRVADALRYGRRAEAASQARLNDQKTHADQVLGLAMKIAITAEHLSETIDSNTGALEAMMAYLRDKLGRKGT